MAVDQVHIDVYTFYQGRGSLNAVVALKNLFDLGLDAGVCGGPMILTGVNALVPEDRAVLAEMIADGYASPTGYAESGN